MTGVPCVVSFETEILRTIQVCGGGYFVVPAAYGSV